MRVSSGKFGGRKLVDNTFEHIRPTADMVKQSIFNKLSSNVLGASVLDLFCGTGALGIEAVSRGAKEVVFADKDYRSINLTKQNLKNLGIEARVITGDYKDVLKSLTGEKFDLILLDPPYKSGVYEEALKLIKNYSLLSDNGIIVCEHDKDVSVDCSEFKILDERKYGIKYLTFLCKTN
jgi:16S rRNA (guanine(966)-N(2))-methyltransferase RsmD